MSQTPRLLGLETLDPRIVPAVTARIDVRGVLIVRIDDNSLTAQQVTIGSNAGRLSVVASAPDGGIKVLSFGRIVAASSIRGITVTGSGLNNTIDLRGVNSSSFRGLDGKISVDARGGNDFILGSIFGETLYGGAGDDVIWASGGNDRLFGNDGFDQFGGGAGNDFLCGGRGIDWFYGGDGSDSISDYRPGEGDWSERDVERK